ncbi:hypothetical protein E1264_38260 [Actinomadura sp. KC216]|uniref:hypothetical protein n=1 Tax=Actinomadura sp. KC216 TaxID=2530370 RepID=UPI00104F6A22|nr:hypothetical protein [Actinomadura sp. KC216]TDB76608.1 hypothetical protein E1264_38260 [Actinomadura sp. KC216]
MTKTDTIPDITLCGHGARTTTTPTLGQLATALTRLAADREVRWLTRFAAGTLLTTTVPAAPHMYCWLTIWPPATRTQVRTTTPQVCMTLTGELTETTVTPAGVIERPLHPTKILVHATPRTRELTNPATTHAVTLHAIPLPPHREVSNLSSQLRGEVC